MKIIAFIAGFFLLSCQSQGSRNIPSEITEKLVTIDYQKLDTATFAGGCFWCVEAAFEQIEGVISAVSGYSGGDAKTADYRRVSSGYTNHAEAVQIFYDPEIISFETLLDIFFTAHDPTQLNRQGPDYGAQYRSEIFYHNEEQKKLSEAKMKELSPSFTDPIVTKLSKLDAFYDAEEYHQDFEEKNPNQGYIVSVSRPKINKVKKKFASILKDSAKD
ncbi:MAG: peptide-methionine (S)-S-oxide reductase MsrA [Ekhidna sp.]